MKVTIFYGKIYEVEGEFNKWAKGKALTKDVIIHTSASPKWMEEKNAYVMIAVYYPEGSQFDT